MGEESLYALASLLFGVRMVFYYDCLRIFRLLFAHRGWAVGLEDGLFWLDCSLRGFLLLQDYGGGVIRWYAVLSAAVGMVTYRRTVSRLVFWLVCRKSG